MKIGVIGAGRVGSTLGRRWSEAGHDVAYGVRDVTDEKYASLQAHASLKSPAEVAESSEVVLLATPYSAAQTILEGLGERLRGKILIDATNPMRRIDGGSSSGGEQVAAWAPGAKVVKAFNTTGFNIMADPVIQGTRTVMLVASSDDVARSAVAGLASEVGFDAVEFGDLSSSRLLESFAETWISLAYKQGLGREFGFALLKREETS